MEQPDKKLVYHGTPRVFDSDVAMPRRNVRSTMGEDGVEKVVFDEDSFHATPHKWIALAYTYRQEPHEMQGKTLHHNMGVSLFENTKVVQILGFGSLEESLQKMYGQGGYVYHFDDHTFIYKEGLGDLEVIAKEPTKPLLVERVDDPVEEMRKLGVTFTFVDLSLPENSRYTD